MKRKPLNHSTDKKVFTKTSGTHPSNATVKSVMRGGIRK